VRRSGLERAGLLLSAADLHGPLRTLAALEVRRFHLSPSCDCYRRLTPGLLSDSPRSSPGARARAAASSMPLRGPSRTEGCATSVPAHLSTVALRLWMLTASMVGPPTCRPSAMSTRSCVESPPHPASTAAAAAAVAPPCRKTERPPCMSLSKQGVVDTDANKSSQPFVWRPG